MESVCVDFRKLPDQNPLFLSFLYDFPRVRHFYPALPRTDAEWQARAAKVLERAHYPRRELVELLEPFNLALGGGEAVRRNLQELRDPGAVAVVTGQQVGLLGGPGFSVYKAATALRLVERLRRLGCKAVPVFWLAADDSDFEEVRKAWLTSPDHGVTEISHPDTRDGDHEAAGAVPLTTAPEWWRELEAVLGRSLASPHWRRGLLEDYVPGRSFREAFARWIHRVFDGHGLLFFDPLLDGYRPGLRQFFQVAVHRRAELLHDLRERDRQLEEAGFVSQVRVEDSESCLFLWQSLERAKLEFAEGRYRVKGNRRLSFSPDELVEGIRSGALEVTPNVLLRPLVQDYLFPTVCGVGGPAEIAYFAQVNAIAHHWDQEPLVVPRAAFTVVDRRSGRYLRRYGLDVADVLGSTAGEVLERIVRHGDREEVLVRLDALRAEVESRLADLASRIDRVDPTVAAKARRTAERVGERLFRLRRRFIENVTRRDENVRRHVEHLLGHLRPQGHLQERVLTFAGFLAEGGPRFLADLMACIDPEQVGHRVVFL